MATQLREVLNQFVHQSAPLSTNQMARNLGIERAILEDMIAYWVRKGKLREVIGTSTGCSTCGIKTACPFIVAMPRYYELVTEDTPPTCESDAPCACGTCSC